MNQYDEELLTALREAKRVDQGLLYPQKPDEPPRFIGPPDPHTISTQEIPGSPVVAPAPAPVMAAPSVPVTPEIRSRWGQIEQAAQQHPVPTQLTGKQFAEGVAEKAHSKLGYAPEAALSFVAQAVDFIPSKVGALRENAEKILTPIMGEQKAQLLLGALSPFPGTAGRGTPAIIDDFIDATGQFRAETRQQFMDAALKMGGKPGRVIAEVQDGLQETLLNLKMFQIGNLPYGQGTSGGNWIQTKNRLVQAFARAELMTATSRHETLGDAAFSFGLSAAYQATPAWSGWAKTTVGAVSRDILANFAISATQVAKVLRESDKIAESEGRPDLASMYKLIGLVQMFGSDIVFGAMTRSFGGKGGPPEIRQVLDQAKIQGESVERQAMADEVSRQESAAAPPPQAPPAAPPPRTPLLPAPGTVPPPKPPPEAPRAADVSLVRQPLVVEPAVAPAASAAPAAAEPAPAAPVTAVPAPKIAPAPSPEAKPVPAAPAAPEARTEETPPAKPASPAPKPRRRAADINWQDRKQGPGGDKPPHSRELSDLHPGKMPLMDFIEQQGKMMSRAAWFAQRGTEAKSNEWDGVITKKQDPGSFMWNKTMYAGKGRRGSSPLEMATRMQKEGLIPNDVPDNQLAETMWNMLRQEIGSRAEFSQQWKNGEYVSPEAKEDRFIQDQAEFAASPEGRIYEIKKSDTPSMRKPVTAEDMPDGALVHIDGEWYKVKAGKIDGEKSVDLVDGERIEGISKADPFGMKDIEIAGGRNGVVKPSTPEWDAAKKEFDRQEQAKPTIPDADDDRPALELKGQTPEERRAAAEAKAAAAKAAAAKDAKEASDAAKKLAGAEAVRDELEQPNLLEVPGETGKLFAGPSAQARAEADARQDRQPKDIRRDAEARSKGGFASTLSYEGLAKVGRRIRSEVSMTKGIPKNLYRHYETMLDHREAGKLWAAAEEKNIQQARNQIVNDMVKKGENAETVRNQVWSDLDKVFRGKLSRDDFAKGWELKPDNKILQALEEIQVMKELRQSALADRRHMSEGLQRQILEDTYYQSRVYERFLLGDKYEPKPLDRQLAVTEVKAGLMDVIDEFALKATEVKGKKINFNIIDYMQSGDQNMLMALSPTRRAAVESLRVQFQEIESMIHSMALEDRTVNGKKETNIAIEKNVDAISRIADGYIDYYLGREARSIGARGGMPIANLQKRFLDGAFKALYGEITDPAIRMRMTTEIQSEMMNQMIFIERMFMEGENQIWARHGDSKFGIRLPDSPTDKMRYGDLAGRYITKEFNDLLNGNGPKFASGAIGAIQKTWMRTLAWQRGAKLIQPRAPIRNFVTNITGYALGSGDIFLKGWNKYHTEGLKIAARYMRGDTEAIRDMASFAEMGIFRASASTFTADLRAAIGTDKDGPLDRWMGKQMNRYSLIDFPTKYASFMVRTQAKGRDKMTAPEAVEHIRSMYQNRDLVPEVIRHYSLIGGRDYSGFTFDSVRIITEQMQFATKRMKIGDPKPLFGVMMSRVLHIAASIGKGAAWLTPIVAAVHKAIRRETENEVDALDDEQKLAFRKFMAHYDKYMPCGLWMETDKTGKQVLYYQVWGNNTAFPSDDWFSGAMQTKSEGGNFTEALWHNLKQQVAPGMTAETIMKALTGKDLQGRSANQTGKGLIDASQPSEDYRRNQIAIEVGFQLMNDMLPGGISTPLRRLHQMEQKETAGQSSDAGYFSRSVTKNDVLFGALRLVRTYRVERGDFNNMVKRALRAPINNVLNINRDIQEETDARIRLGGATPAQVSQAQKAEMARVKYFSDIRSILNQAEKVMPGWMSQQDRITQLQAAGLDKIDIVSALNEVELPRSPKPYKSQWHWRQLD